MSRIEGLLIGIVLAALLAAGAWFGMHHYAVGRYDAGYAAAIAVGKELRDSAATANLAIESGLRAQLLDRDTAALRKDQEYATNLDAAQRRVRAGTDRLRCPTGPVPAAAATADRPAASEPTADGGGPQIVPEDAAEILGDGAAVAGLVRRYERVVGRFEACRAVNARP
jgi:hypothetical protein